MLSRYLIHLICASIVYWITSISVTNSTYYKYQKIITKSTNTITHRIWRARTQSNWSSAVLEDTHTWTGRYLFLWLGVSLCKEHVQRHTNETKAIQYSCKTSMKMGNLSKKLLGSNKSAHWVDFLSIFRPTIFMPRMNSRCITRSDAFDTLCEEFMLG